MNRPTDEILLAYADDALDTDERRRVALYLETDPEASRLVAALRASRHLPAEAFTLPEDRPAPEGLVRMIKTGIPAVAPPASGNVVRHRRGLPQVPDRMRRMALPLAACLALAIGFGAGWLTAGARSPAAAVASLALDPVPPGTPLQRLLEQHATGRPIAAETVGNRQDMYYVVMATFRDKRGLPCREIELQAAQGQPILAGIACRNATGRWTLEGAARLAQAPAAGGAIVPSGVSERDVLDGLLNVLGAKSALTAAEESELLRRGWR